MLAINSISFPTYFVIYGIYSTLFQVLRPRKAKLGLGKCVLQSEGVCHCMSHSSQAQLTCMASNMPQETSS